LSQIFILIRILEENDEFQMQGRTCRFCTWLIVESQKIGEKTEEMLHVWPMMDKRGGLRKLSIQWYMYIVLVSTS
jgi:hypothetical protein